MLVHFVCFSQRMQRSNVNEYKWAPIDYMSKHLVHCWHIYQSSHPSSLPAYSCQGHTHTHTHTCTHSHTHTHAINKATFRLIQRYQLSWLADVLTWNRNIPLACGAVRSLCYPLRCHGPLALNETLLLLWAYWVAPCSTLSSALGRMLW